MKPRYVNTCKDCRYLTSDGRGDHYLCSLNKSLMLVCRTSDSPVCDFSCQLYQVYDLEPINQRELLTATLRYALSSGALDKRHLDRRLLGESP